MIYQSTSTSTCRMVTFAVDLPGHCTGLFIAWFVGVGFCKGVWVLIIRGNKQEKKPIKVTETPDCSTVLLAQHLVDVLCYVISETIRDLEQTRERQPTWRGGKYRSEWEVLFMVAMETVSIFSEQFLLRKDWDTFHGKRSSHIDNMRWQERYQQSFVVSYHSTSTKCMFPYVHCLRTTNLILSLSCLADMTSRCKQPRASLTNTD